MEEDLGKKSRRIVLRLLGIMYDIRSKWEKRLESFMNRYTSQSIGEFPFSEFKDIVLGYFADFHSEISRSVVKYVQTLIEKYTSTIKDLETRITTSKIYNNVVEDLRKEIEALREKNTKLQNFMKKELLRTLKYKILAVLEKDGELNVKKLATRLNVSENQVRKYLKELEDEKFIEIRRDVRPYVISLLKTPWSF
ncbi:MAG: winged helix-turn-helix domain-containing protein [Candidatus Baldrarchaeia archaeon]